MNYRILGPLSVTDDNGNELPLGGSKQEALLAILLLHANQVVSSDQLIEDLWGEDASATAAKTLQVYVSRLRHSLGDGASLVTHNGGYLLEVGPEELDSARFADLVAQATTAHAEGADARASARVREALDLWSGAPLSDFTYASFAQAEIVRLEELRLAALELRIEAELALGRHTELIAELRSLVARYPVREHLRAQLMLALYRAGRQADALQIYRAGRRRLVEQLGIEPGAELRDLERAILEQDPALVPAPRRAVAGRKPEAGAGETFVGYERELTALEELVEQALAGSGSVALITGEPGIGKSRLTDELSAVARARGADVLWGRCWEAGGAPAYWPWIQALRAHVRESDPDTLRTELGPVAGEIAELLPELHDLLADLPQAQLEGADGSRFRVFDAIAIFLRRAAESKPLVVVLDDIHAADQPSLLLLEFLAGALAEAPILLIGAYRDTEVGAEHPSRPLLAGLGRAGNCKRVALGGLSQDDTAHFVELSAGVAPMPRLAAALHDAAGGNPLFVNEIVRLLAAEGRLNELDDGGLVLPGGLGEVISRRLQRLSDDCRRTLALAAVVGREFETGLIEAAGDSTGEQLLEELTEAASARVIEDVPGARGVMRFSHVVVRDTLYAELSAVARTRLHMAVGEALEHIGGQHGTELAGLAHHFAEAIPVASPLKAIDYTLRAGEAAAALLAYEEAIRLYEMAAAIAGATEGAGAQRTDALARLGEQLVQAGEIARAEAALAEAEAVFGDSPDPTRRARIDVARAHLDFVDACSTGRPRLEEVLELAGRLEDPALEASAWWALRTWYQGLGQIGEAAKATEKMLECARRAGNKGLVSQAVAGLAASLMDGPTPVSEAIPRVLALRSTTTSVRTESMLLIYLGQLEATRGRYDQARAYVAESRALVQEIEASTDILLAATCRRARLERWAGDLEASERIAREGCELLERGGFVSYLRSDLVDVADVLLDQGRVEEAEVELARAEALFNPEDVDAVQRQARARARIEIAHGNGQAAVRAAQKSLDYVFKMDMPTEHAESWVVMAHAQAAAGNQAEARSAAETAFEIAASKECVPWMDRAQAVTAELDPVATLHPA